MTNSLDLMDMPHHPPGVISHFASLIWKSRHIQADGPVSLLMTCKCWPAAVKYCRQLQCNSNVEVSQTMLRLQAGTCALKADGQMEQEAAAS